MKKIPLTLDHLRAHLGLKKNENLSGDDIAQLIIDGAVVATDSKAFEVKEIKLDTAYISFFGQTTREETLVFGRPEICGTAFLYLKD